MTLMNALARLKKYPLLAISDHTADFTSTGVDWRAQGYEGLVGVLLARDAAGGTNPTCAAKLQHCDTVGGTYVDVPSGAFAAIAGTAGEELLAVDTRVLKQFIAINFDLSGTSPDYHFGAWLLGFEKYQK
jgi:hypothetical protein